MDKIVEMKPNKKLNRKKLSITIAVIVMAILVIIIAILYNTSKNVRKFMDQYIFFKNVSEEKVPMIEIDYDSNTNIIPYGKSICILAENTLFQYNSSGKLETEVKVEITTPVYGVEGKYLVLGEKNSKKLYLISGNHIIWEKEVDGNLKKVTVNKNGYVSAILTGTTHKSVIITYDAKGKELFKSYLSNTIAVDAYISPDNSELAYAEVNTSGTVVQSNIKIISTQEAKEKNTEPKFTYTAPQNNLILRIKYQDKNKLVCLYDNSIHLIQDNEDKEILKLNEENQKITFGDINLDNFIFRTVEKSTGLFNADTVIEMQNITSGKQVVYTIEEVAKDIICSKDVIAVNIGTEVYFVNTSGWLIKHYESTQVIRNIVVCDGLAGIIYRDKIELIHL